MKQFAELINALESTNKTNAKIDAIVDYLERASDDDKLWFIALFTGKKPKRNVNTNYMKEWALEITQLPFWLFQESYSSVGDLGETLSLILPPPNETVEKSLSEWMQEIINLKNKSDAEKKEFVLNSWNGLDYIERLIFNKLLGGSFRIGVSSKTLINALTKFSGQEASTLMHSLMGKWKPNEVNFKELISAENINPDNSKPYPFCLAYPLEKDLEELGTPDEWLIEYKWDGIRGQIIKRNDEVFIWSRGEELVTEQFPEIVEVIQSMKGNFVLDGEILAVKDDKVLNFNELQKRLNRKTITKKMLAEIPIEVFVYDLLELEGTDLREKPISARRAMLEELLLNENPEKIKLSQVIEFENWEDLNQIRENSREINSEGLMLKQKDSHYHSGRKKGDWWKWKINPMTIDAVLIYAQKGSGRRSAYYTDYSFAVKSGDKLVTIAKAYSGLTDKEIMEVSKFVNKNAIEKFGPVRTVKPELVFEIAFEGIGFSNRHKSGVALRFPRILRWRKDKTVDDIDDIEEIKNLIQ
ncbi:ATP-dependent DNA ligase [Chryseobacterium sp. Ch-15]|uniref:DNA ligase (ATP) n=1 Tax=Chryseobacterium muglaense TaxID=2893752 RepID=A0A9Q3YU34_9FLAO|nr:ATP-dependent DNA ligase [Chryseobacterium muglaense]MBD3904177.1 ATP-dependent DNA ligase [Chryseobacterium muglaense]MCC9033250.1 ATP-dependent DNA ligase [Chryseobacterium muglaense]MCM2553745.1 ATP-dependent DNA ligase [Chryseobacterium muglaense]